MATKLEVYTESGYRCAVPSCREILVLDVHHLVELGKGGSDDPSNLLALCPTCHALHHRGTIPQEALYVYKSVLVAISRAFDLAAVDYLLLLDSVPDGFLVLSGDGILQLGRLIAARLAAPTLIANNNGLLVTYSVALTGRGKQLVTAWREGDEAALKIAVGDPGQGTAS